MKPSLALERHRAEVRRMVSGRRVINPRVFGSVAAGTDTATSDLDLLVDPLPGASMFDIIDLRDDLQELLGVRVDLLTPRALSKYYRDEVIDTAIPI